MPEKRKSEQRLDKLKEKLEAEVGIAPACPRCLQLAKEDRIRAEAVMPLPPGAMAPLAQDGSGKCCYDCSAADTLTRRPGLSEDLTQAFVMARVVIANERQEGLRLSVEMRRVMGLTLQGRMREYDKTLEEHQAWLDRAVPWWSGEDA